MSRTGWAVVAAAVGAVAVAAKKAGKRIRLARGVYMEEVSSGAKPIEAVGTAVAAFVGLAPNPRRDDQDAVADDQRR
jgi:hypothetical protein